MIGRLKFNIDKLVDEMLDQLPAQVWTDPAVTFCDPAMAGGQLVKNIEKRLLANGHSPDSVNARVFGFETNPMTVTFAIIKHSLIGTYRTCDVLSESVDRQFDVVISAPPFDNNHDSKRWTKWKEYADHNWNVLCSANGILAMVTPISWQSGGDLYKRFTDHAVMANLNVNRHFNVGSTFSFWVMTKAKPQQDFRIVHRRGHTDIARNTGWLPREISPESLEINRKVFASGHPTFDFKRTTEYHTSKKHLFNDRGEKRIFHTLAQMLHSDHLADHYAATKAMITLSGYSKVLVERDIGCSQAVAWMAIPSEHADHARALLNGKFYQYLLNINKWSGWNSLDVIKQLPRVDLGRAWTNSELYAHFGLLDDEINYIDATMRKSQDDQQSQD